jgi:murein DD-endopeptidase MepM/ murein hydrolase activator NlpD
MEVNNEADDTEKNEAAEENSAAEETADIKEALISSVSEPRFAIIPPSARPGEPVTVAYRGAVKPALQAVLLDQRGRRVTKALFFRLDDEQGIVAAVLAVPSTALTGNALIRIEAGEDTVKELPFAINSREFQSETIALNQENTDLRTVPDPQKTAESEQLWAILSRTGKDIYSDCLFIPPVSSTRRTSFYGSRRVYEYADGKSDTTIHAGIDIGVPTGTGVLACAPGKVVLARSRIVTGNTVILEHLPGLYSLYYHMDSIAVAEGSLVEAQTFLGESGSTGLATGPHLHWEIRVSGENADPDAFLSSPVLDKNDILNKLN